MEYKHLKDKHGFSINGWMVREYHLSGNELLAFGLVFCLSQGEAGLYTGGIPFMSEFFGWAPNTCRKYLRILIDKGLVEDHRGEINGVPFCYYSVVASVLDNHPSKNEGYPSRFEVPTPQNLHEDTLQDLKINNKEKNNKSLNNPPSPQEVAAYCRTQGFKDPDGFAAYYCAYQNENGWMTGKGKNRKPIDNWKLNVISWGRYHKTESFPDVKDAAAIRTISTDEAKRLFR